MPESSQTLLKRLIELVEAQTREIKALREEVRALKPPEPPLPRARIEPDTGYEYMGLCLYLDARTWAAIKKGAHVTVKGQGYSGYEVRPDPDDPDFGWDYWEFFGGIGRRLRVTMRSPHYPERDDFFDDPYDDDLKSEDIQEF